ncbi:MAG: hypothetical protein KKC79_01135 [Gammaproteobacteria bacterium]|nr:hypothetical protein [Gammaproteobacteria bacterium]MBU1441744.1 hypothetical protein [Gammaproteobacteria bacterium]MBU2287265.1 hypothetical protein [Gammaproteobacteria bacterium]MBU2407234.1 hypothetical protein [Gammaproteobacteria bacterium]
MPIAHWIRELKKMKTESGSIRAPTPVGEASLEVRSPRVVGAAVLIGVYLVIHVAAMGALFGLPHASNPTPVRVVLGLVVMPIVAFAACFVFHRVRAGRHATAAQVLRLWLDLSSWRLALTVMGPGLVFVWVDGLGDNLIRWDGAIFLGGVASAAAFLDALLIALAAWLVRRWRRETR